MNSEFIFGREAELASLRERLQQRRPVLVHGPCGVGKTLLLKSLLWNIPHIIYCEQSATMNGVLRCVATALFRSRSAKVLASCGKYGEAALAGRSALAIKGIVLETLRSSQYCLVLDHVRRPSTSFAATVREIIGWAKTPVIAVARSAHMEDSGFLQPFYPDRTDRFEIRNFDDQTGERFARAVVRRTGLSAQNLEELLDRVLRVSDGNPGAILAMLEMAANVRYRSNDHVKVSTLYIDFRLNWRPELR